MGQEEDVPWWSCKSVASKPGCVVTYVNPCRSLWRPKPISIISADRHQVMIASMRPVTLRCPAAKARS